MQEISTGRTMYSDILPGATGKQMLPPGQQFAMLFGNPGTGKSHFLESNPDAYILNLDLTSTSHPEPAATTWPILRSDGTFDPNPTWPKVMEIIDKLVEAALTNMSKIVKEWVPEGLPYASTTGKSFLELDGQMAYGFLSDTILAACLKLRAAGYGVWVVGHTHESITRNEQGTIVGSKILPTFSEGLWKRLAPNLELVASMIRTQTTASEEEEYVDHRGRTRTRRNTRTVNTHRIGFQVRDLAPYYKSRAYPEVDIPKRNSWAAFEDAYTAELESTQASNEETETK